MKIYPPPPPGTQPENACDAYRSTLLRAPRLAPVPLPHTPTELAGPRFDRLSISGESNLTNRGSAEPQGQRIVVAGKVIDEDGRPVRGALVEIWQANAAGRYLHSRDHHPAPLDPNFAGAGRALTDDDGVYRFLTIRPGAYPWRNHPNAWRPAHIHFSLFGAAWASRLVTQMYFPGDPLIPLDPILQSIPDEEAKRRLMSSFELDLTEPVWALGYRFNIVLRGREATPFEEPPCR